MIALFPSLIKKTWAGKVVKIKHPSKKLTILNSWGEPYPSEHPKMKSMNKTTESIAKKST